MLLTFYVDDTSLQLPCHQRGSQNGFQAFSHCHQKKNSIAVLLIFKHIFWHWIVFSFLTPFRRKLFVWIRVLLLPVSSALSCQIVLERESCKDCTGWPFTSGTNLWQYLLSKERIALRAWIWDVAWGSFQVCDVCYRVCDIWERRKLFCVVNGLIPPILKRIWNLVKLINFKASECALFSQVYTSMSTFSSENCT